MKWYEIILIILVFVVGIYTRIKVKERISDFYNGRNSTWREDMKRNRDKKHKY